eukprot:1530984-Rhodomonas_salina.1
MKTPQAIGPTSRFIEKDRTGVGRHTHLAFANVVLIRSCSMRAVTRFLNSETLGASTRQKTLKYCEDAQEKKKIPVRLCA